MFSMNDIVAQELKAIIDMRARLEGKCVVSDNMSLYGKVTKAGGVRYHVRMTTSDGKRVSRGIGGETNEEVITIKQAFFNREMNRRLEHNEKILRRIDGAFLDYNPEEIDGALPEIYRDQTGLVDKFAAYSLSAWQNTKFMDNRFPMPQNANQAADGTRMRSKSEIILYNIICDLGLPVKYDVDINLVNETGEKVYKNADFVFPHKDGGLVVLEHLGLLDDDTYLTKAVHKVRLYQRNGYTVNDRLFLTADDTNGKFNAFMAKELVKVMIMPRVLMI